MSNKHNEQVQEDVKTQNEAQCNNCENCDCEETAAPLTEVELLKQEIETLQAQLTEAKNDYYKAFADAENRKKRLQQDYDTNMKYRVQSFALDILPAIDNFERALAQEVNDEATKAYIKGYQMIYEQIMNALIKEGIEVIPTTDQPFDPNVHHAIMVEKVDGVKEGIVLQELQKGYKLKDRVIRASMVKVSE